MVDGTARDSLTRGFPLYWLPVLLWAAFIFYLSSQSVPPQPPGVSLLPQWSSMAHFGLYLVLGALLYRGFQGRGFGLLDGRPVPGDTGAATKSSMLPVTAYFLSFLAGALFGASDEVHQYFVPLRQMDPVDWMVDVAGVMAGSFVLLLWHLRRNKP